MRHIDDWDAIQEKQDGEFDSPAPGGYIVKICGVEDREDKEYLKIQWDFTEPPYAGLNRDTFIRAGFWPTELFRSYKESALGFFKAFKTMVEDANPGYRFDDRAVQSLVGKKMGVVLREEEYQKNDGAIGKRLTVYQVRSPQSIREGDFKVPELKRLFPHRPASRPIDVYPGSEFAKIGEEDGNLPF